MARRPTGQAQAVPEAFTRNWLLFVITGILWLLLGFMCLSYRAASVSIAVVFIAVVFWMASLSAFAVAAATRGGWRALAGVAGVLGSLAAVGALVWPDPTLLIVSVYVAWFLLIRGVFDVVVSLSHTEVRGWWLHLIAGIISIGLGAWAIGNPDRSVLLLITIIGIFAIFHGAAELTAGLQYRQLRRDMGLGAGPGPTRPVGETTRRLWGRIRGV
jgi:uncharacterized membrane protein HdeD (DUF308 family)